MSYLVYQKNNPVGIFDDIELCKDYIKSIEENNWATNFRVVKYKKNSCLKLFDKKISFLNKSDTNKTNYESMIVGDSKGISSNDCEEKFPDNQDDPDTIQDVGINKFDSTTLTEEDKKKLKKIAKEQQRDQTRMNLLKLQKEKILESKNKYDVDLKLYEKFRKLSDDNSSFEIPEIFTEKYKIFKNLDDENDLSWETFAKDYKEGDFKGKFSNVFEISNEFENKFRSFSSNYDSEDDDDKSSDDSKSSDDNSDDSSLSESDIENLDSEESND